MLGRYVTLMPDQPPSPRPSWSTTGVIALLAFLAGTAVADDGPADSAYPARDISDGAANARSDAASATLEPVRDRSAEPLAAFAPVPPAPDPEPERMFDTPTYFANCSAARAAGAAPVREGDPGYAPRLDRDGDGVGCE
jgi:hypothetical protein